MAKFHGNILNLGETIAKSFRGGYFLTHTVYLFNKATYSLTYYCQISFFPLESNDTTRSFPLSLVSQTASGSCKISLIT